MLEMEMSFADDVISQGSGRGTSETTSVPCATLEG